MNDLTAFQRDMLFVVSGLGAPKGVEVKEELDAYYESEIHHGRLYPNLEELVEKGLISKGQKDNRTNEYTLTELGVQAIETRREWEDHYRKT
jgi:DNA-binding PadR family transcriptional regulator